MMDHMNSIIDRHDKIALQFSGGRDSIACLYLLRPWLDKIAVYWLNTGSAYPETIAIMDHARALCPTFIEIDGNQPGVIEQYGLPSDIVPASRTPIGLVGSGSDAQAIQDRYSCCARTRMLPLHHRMMDDGVTLIIRGQKDADHMKGPLRSGTIEQGIEYLYPIEEWSAEQVDNYLARQDAPVPRFYEMMDSMPDCMTCSAWWENGAAQYLKRYHYPQYKEVQLRLDVINEAVGEHIVNFNKEVI